MGAGSISCTIAALAMLLLAGYFTLVEAAFSNASRARIKALEDSERRTRRALSVLDDWERARGAILIGTNLAHVALAALVTYVAIDVWPLWSAAVAAVCAALLVFFLAEAIPKCLAVRRAEREMCIRDRRWISR